MRPRLAQLHQSGATDGQVVTWDNTAGMWVPETPSGGSGLPTGGTAGQVLTKDSGTDYDVSWQTPSGGGGTVVDLLYTPATGQTTVDEFNDASLSGSWVAVDPVSSAHVSWVESGDALSLNTKGTCTGTDLHALLRPLSSHGGSMVAGDAFITCYTMLGNYGSDYIFGGIILTDGTTVGAGTQVIAFNGSGAGGPQAWNQIRGATNFTSVGGGTNMGWGNTIDWPKRLYSRLVMTAANTWRTDVSPDGIQWLTGTATHATTLTPTHVGLYGSSYTGAAKGITSFEFLRRVAGVS